MYNDDMPEVNTIGGGYCGATMPGTSFWSQSSAKLYVEYIGTGDE